MFNPPSAPGPLYLFVSVSVLLLGWTLIGIPLSAWTAELSHDYHERSRLTGARTWGGVSGALLAVIAPLVLSVLAATGYPSLAPDAPGSLQPLLKVLAFGTVALLLISVPFLLMSVRQPAFIARAARSRTRLAPHRGQCRVPPSAAVQHVRRDRLELGPRAVRVLRHGVPGCRCQPMAQVAGTDGARTPARLG